MASPYLSKLDILIDLYLTLNARSGEEAKPRRGRASFFNRSDAAITITSITMM
jgi:hypothetical protein